MKVCYCLLKPFQLLIKLFLWSASKEAPCQSRHAMNREFGLVQLKQNIPSAGVTTWPGIFLAPFAQLFVASVSLRESHAQIINRDALRTLVRKGLIRSPWLIALEHHCGPLGFPVLQPRHLWYATKVKMNWKISRWERVRRAGFPLAYSQ